MRYKYTKWTSELENHAKFLLQFYKNYDEVSSFLDIPRDVIKNRNNKYWNIDCRMKWTQYNDHYLDEMLCEGATRKEISSFFNTSENAINIRLYRKLGNK